ncbi:MAG: flagellar hook-basal body complex protein FliE [Clostridiales bacterium]|nr:flagellar hook-basal body complex protein FliE [Clostridiales bacterium]
MIESLLGAQNAQRVGQLLPGIEKGGEPDAFAHILKDLLSAENTNNMSTEEIIAGDINNLAAAMVDMAQADLTLQYTLQVRNKVVEAYQEIMRMQV